MKFKYTLPILLAIWTTHAGSAQLVVNFSAEEGYVDGPVHRQPATGDKWREQRAGSFTVNADKGVLVFDSTAESWSNATYPTALGVADVYIIAIDLTITVGSPVLADGNSMMNRFDLFGDDGNASASLRQRGEAPNLFDLWAFDGVGEKPNASLQSTGFSGEAIGLVLNKKGTKYKNGTSDPLRLLIVHRKTGEGPQFTTAAVLRNLKTDQEVQKVVLPDWNATEAWVNQADKMFRITTGNMNQKSADKGATSIFIDSLKIGVATEQG
jgi:hypothetical protein